MIILISYDFSFSFPPRSPHLSFLLSYKLIKKQKKQYKCSFTLFQFTNSNMSNSYLGAGEDLLFYSIGGGGVETEGSL